MIPKVVLISLFLLTLSACSTTEIVEKPVPVEVVKTEFVPVPADLVAEIPKNTVPDGLTFADALELWSEDRAIIDTLNARLRGIQGLSEDSE